MSSSTVLSWWLWLLVLMSSSPALGHNATGNRYELPCGVGPINYNRIVNGMDALPGQYPFMVNLVGRTSRYFHLCGAVIIGKSHILTTSHCLESSIINITKQMEVHIGDHDQSAFGDGERRVLIEPPVMHPGVGERNDIALIRTVEPMQFFLNHSGGHGSVNQICMPNKGHRLSNELEGFESVVAGWGDLYKRKEATVLQQLSMKVFECPPFSPVKQFITYRGMICARSDSPEKTPWHGDSGGPLFWLSPEGQAYLIGLVERGIKGHPGEGVFVDVRPHSDWITKMMASRPPQPSPQS